MAEKHSSGCYEFYLIIAKYYIFPVAVSDEPMERDLSSMPYNGASVMATFVSVTKHQINYWFANVLYN